MTAAIIALILSGFGLLGGALVMLVKIVRHLTNIETGFKQMGKIVAHVPNLNYRVTTIERHLELSTPDLPVYMNGTAEE